MSQPENPKQTEAMLHDDVIPTTNKTNNRTFADVLKVNLSRRSVLQGTAAATAASAGFFAPGALANMWSSSAQKADSGELVGFQPVTLEAANAVDQTWPVISPDYDFQVLIPWGTPLEPGACEEWAGDPDTRPSPEDAALQIGVGHDGMWFYPGDAKKGYGIEGYEFVSTHGVLCINHEYGSNTHVLGKSAPENLDDVRRMQHAMGVSVVAIAKRKGGWKNVKDKKSRRIHANTPFMFSGPAAKSDLLKNGAGNVPLGTLNNCGSGPTPWDTYLTCEENFNGYFGASMPMVLSEEQERYGLSENGSGYGWYNFDKRFDLSDDDYANECNRFGWIMEIDPFDATQTPVKRTALGRFKHEAIAIGVAADRRVAAYMGDDERFNYCYKYISDRSIENCEARGVSPLDEGKLYVAKFNDDGTGEWMELTIENPVLAERFADQGEVLIYARIAADLLGATPMDRPEWTTVGKDGEVYWTMTNNSQRTEPNAANPETPNTHGHIIKTTGGHVNTSFRWEIFMLASSTSGTEGSFASPDAAWADAYGRLFIGTDGGQDDGLQDQLTVLDTSNKNAMPKRLFMGVVSDEITGFTITPDQRTAFINMQHPGNGDPAATNFPAPRDYMTIPRDCTIVITKKDGGIIGS
ncbi:PhoX family protein [Halioxenophilus aromaticivorans]|uniref:PhoX family phosphatase n=1 Tax=Halioxenophilus aromaticivorans TaxID=1306992 RepID=A0AAV3U5S6_9ALTE